MAVETLGEALAYGWRITARCAWGKQREGLQSKESASTGRARPRDAGVDARPRLSALVAGIAVALSALRLAAGEVDLFDADERQCGERAGAGGGEADDEEVAAEAMMRNKTNDAANLSDLR